MSLSTLGCELEGGNRSENRHNLLNIELKIEKDLRDLEIFMALPLYQATTSGCPIEAIPMPLFADTPTTWNFRASGIVTHMLHPGRSLNGI